MAQRLRAGERELLVALARAPVRLRSDNLVERPWGGRWLLDLKRLDDRPGRFGESFELAADPDDREAREHPSIVALDDGSTIPLPELLELAGDKLLGSEFVTAYGPRIPLLPKLLDVETLLSVQAHPPGNPELYLVIDADPGATLRLGWREPIDPQQLVAELVAGRAAQEQLLAALDPATDLDALQAELGALLARGDALSIAEQVEALAYAIAPALRPELEPARTNALLERMVATYRSMLARMNELEVRAGDIIYNACPSDPCSSRAPSSEVHALGNPQGRRLLLFEIRRPGATYRAWDHLRFPLRELTIEQALASMSHAASKPEQFRVQPRPLPGRPNVLRSIESPAFVVDHLRPTPDQPVETLRTPLPSTLHLLRGAVELRDAEGRTLALHAGQSLLLPAGLDPLELRVSRELGDQAPVEAVQVQLPIGPQRRPDESPSLAAKRRNWDDLRRIVARSQGPSEVLAIVNPGDIGWVQRRLESLTTSIFRRDGNTRVCVCEEPQRRGQLLGLLDALRQHRSRFGRLDPDRVALAIMLPGKGTRLSPLTQRLHGIKPSFPLPIRPSADAPWLDGATASLYSWVLVTNTLERLGFRGLACKWGDEPQVPARVLARLDVDLSQADAVRFGARVRIDEDLARNKEWLGLYDDGSLRVQVRRRPLAQLRERLHIPADAIDPIGYVHLGSPAFSHRFLAAAERAFAGCQGWIDVDGYLFEALTHEHDEWQREVELDPELRALLARVPDFFQRARSVREQLERERGQPLRIHVIDFGAELHWVDIGQLGKAREAYSLLGDPREPGEVARMLAAIDSIEPDRWGNRVVGRSAAPDDGSVRECVLIDAVIGSGPAERAVVVRSRLAHARLEPGSVAIDCRVAALELGRDALAFGSRLSHLVVPAGWVHTSIPRDPTTDEPVLESWWADAGTNPGSADNYERPIWDNPDSFANKFEQMRQREVAPEQVERRIASRHD